MNELINIKGGREGLRLQFDAEAGWPLLLAALREQLSQNGSFFSGARLVIDIGERQINADQVAEVLALMQQHGVQLEALSAGARESRAAARAAGLTARPPVQRRVDLPSVAPDSEAQLLVRTVRSGQVVRYHGHVTLIGDVNAGAEIIAGGSIIVWGRLRGVVHAGALGSRQEVICALELQPTQLRIADLITRTPEGQHSHLPEVARIEGDQIIVETWVPSRR